MTNRDGGEIIREIVNCIRVHCSPTQPDWFTEKLEDLMYELAATLKREAIEP